MRPILLVFCVFALWAAPDPLAPLTIYSGAWQVTRKGAAKPEALINQCAKAGHFYACDQSVDGGPGALLVFIPRTGQAGSYYTQNIRPEGRATSRGDLEIKGATWTFLSHWDASGQTIYYRTIDTFSGKGRIQYEQAESNDGKNWKVTNSGEQTRVVRK